VSDWRRLAQRTFGFAGAMAFLWLMPLTVHGQGGVTFGDPVPCVEPPPAIAPSTSTPAPPPPLWSGDLCTRSQVSGDWCGPRDHFADSGATFFGDLTQYYQGVTMGGRARQFRYGDRADYLLDFDSSKLGLWQGFHVDLRAETRFGQDCNSIDGIVAPSNFAMLLPVPNQSLTALTGVQFTQDVGENLSVFFGKLNLLDGTPESYLAGRRLNAFWNAGLLNNLSRVYLTPSVLGAGLVIKDDHEPVFLFYVLDTRYTPTTSGFETLFDNGVLLYGEYQIRTNWLDRPGHSAVGVLYSNATREPNNPNPYIVIPVPPGVTLPPPRSNAWSVTYRFDQVLNADPENPKRNWTVRGDAGLTDGDPNPIHWFANVALVGNGPFRSRGNDTLGIGYYHLQASNLSFLKTLGFGAENGVELFYNAPLTPWFHLTPDLQVVDPANRHNGAPLLVGLRGRLSF
jgi:porin